MVFQITCFLSGYSLGTKKYRGSNSNDGGNTGDGVKIAGGVIGSSDSFKSSKLHFLDFFNDPRIIREQRISAYNGYEIREYGMRMYEGLWVLFIGKGPLKAKCALSRLEGVKVLVMEVIGHGWSLKWVKMKENKPRFWATTKIKTVNGERQIQALVDKKKVIITESSIRSDLHLEDADGTDCLPTATIFEELARIGYEKPSQKLTFYKAFFSPQWKFLIHTIIQCLSSKTTAWNEFSSTMASAIICLATNQKFNLSKYIFDAMVKHLEGGVKFLMYPRFVQVFINQQLGDMSHHKKIYVNPSHTKKILANMKREGKEFSRRVTPLFATMMVQANQEEGVDSGIPTASQQTPITIQPSISKPQKKQSRRKQKKTTTVSHPSDSTTDVLNEEFVPTHSNDPLLSGEDRLKLTDLIDMCTKLSKRGEVDDAEMFDTDALIGNEVFVKNDMIEKEQDVIPKEVSTVLPLLLLCCDTRASTEYNGL
ncbi:hypothetical protein Tco_1054563 [Tanacetum coccineum]|uniref:Uncharacterized protein n=1 Tax=Tanacetum coccineum TaxID=301880 RepID=A0ABQ5GX46_9ASTR